MAARAACDAPLTPDEIARMDAAAAAVRDDDTEMWERMKAASGDFESFEVMPPAVQRTLYDILVPPSPPPPPRPPPQPPSRDTDAVSRFHEMIRRAMVDWGDEIFDRVVEAMPDHALALEALRDEMIDGLRAPAIF